MTDKEASQRLTAFERDHGRESLRLACHAALPVVLNPDVLHLLRINYFLDPPHTLPYMAEASLLLSSLCTEIDDGLYTISAEVRDLLLTRLIEDYGGVRVRDVAQLLWEYSQRGAPWAQRPGLTEAQQLTALNFIDPPRALGWLARARRGEGALPVDDDRWFVVLERDLIDRAAAVEEAEGEAIFPGGKLPALTELRDALMKLYRDPRAALRLSAQLGLAVPGVSRKTGASRLWQATLDAVWISNRMTEFLEAASKDLGKSESWTQALREYWFRLSPALRVEGTAFEPPPPEWQILEQHRENLENAIRALAIIYIRPPSEEPRVFGMGALVGDYVIATHRSMVEKAFDGRGRARKLKRGYRLWAEFAEDHAFLRYDAASPRSQRRLELIGASIEQHTGLGLLTSHPKSDRTRLPQPLHVMAGAPPFLKGRKVCVMGYPARDSRNEPAALSRLLGDTYDVLRLQPGEIIEEDLSKGLIIHNCFTAGGNGGSPLIDVQTGHVLGLHIGGIYEPGPRGFKKAQAIATFRLSQNPLVVNAGVFRSPSVGVVTHLAPAVYIDDAPAFINRMSEQQLFMDMLDKERGQVLFVEGPAGIGKTALLSRFAQMADERGIRTLFLDASSGTAGDDEAKWLSRFRNALHMRAVLFVDALEKSTGRLIKRMMEVAHMTDRQAILVIAGRHLGSFAPLPSPDVQVLRLAPLDSEALRAWLGPEMLTDDSSEQTLSAVVAMSGGVPANAKIIIENLRDSVWAQSERGGNKPSMGPDLVPTVPVTRPVSSAIVFHDDPSETHGFFVVTRGAHTITVPDRYRIGTFPVTNAVFGEFVRAGGYQYKEFWLTVPRSTRARFNCQNGAAGPGTWPSPTPDSQTAEHPVAGISYYEALAFVAWLDRSVAAPDDMQWCLPSENMWEFAARGASGLLYPWGPSFEPDRCNSKEANINTTSPVGRFSEGVSPFGVHDMAGNVWEFVRAFDEDQRTCVLRGGSFLNIADEVRNSLRLIRVPREHRPPDFGLRCALEPRNLGKGDRSSPPKRVRKRVPTNPRAFRDWH